MKKNRLGNTDLYVSPVAFGVMTMGRSQLDLPLDEGAELIRYAFAKGINFFDTAQYYETYPYIREAFRTLGSTASGADRPVICTKSLCLSYEDMEHAIEEALRESIYIIIQKAKSVLEQTPPELSSDIINKGIIITGGGALIDGFDKLLSAELNVPVYVAESPLTCVAEGTGILLDHIDLLEK